MKEVLQESGMVSSNKRKKVKISQGLRYILKKCTCEDPSDRYQSVTELKKDLEGRNLVVFKAIAENTQVNMRRLLRANKKKPISPYDPMKNTDPFPGSPMISPPPLYCPPTPPPYSYDHDQTELLSDAYGETVLLSPDDYVPREEDTV